MRRGPDRRDLSPPRQQPASATRPGSEQVFTWPQRQPQCLPRPQQCGAETNFAYYALSEILTRRIFAHNKWLVVFFPIEFGDDLLHNHSTWNTVQWWASYFPNGFSHYSGSFDRKREGRTGTPLPTLSSPNRLTLPHSFLPRPSSQDLLQYNWYIQNCT